ncbi:MAG: SpvB/TcaC N-terminal domain-containing protein, partial [Deltaproteobacteria bacterium]|nr:SpvB/TcaC N-terminal domain-containing protein [Deltaproteobacteria bacterium]
MRRNRFSIFIFVFLFLLPAALGRAQTESSVDTGTAAPEAGVEADASDTSNDISEHDYYTGAATHRIAFEVPPGRAGMQPKLVLTYNSSRREVASNVGQGWNLNPGFIERNTSDGIDYFGSNFVFEANGQRIRLVFVAHHPHEFYTDYECDEFQAKVETGGAFVRFFRCPDPLVSSTTFYWVAYDKQGVRHTFGTLPQARLQSTDSRMIFRWYLEGSADPNGNVVNYVYSKSTSNGLGEVLLDYIDYTSHGDATPRFKVTFNYQRETALGVSINFPARHNYFNGNLLRNIRVTDGGTEVRTYNFGYVNLLTSQSSVLYSVQMTAPGLNLPQKLFEYSSLIPLPQNIWGAAMSSQDTVSGDTLEWNDSYHSWFDMNGDGYIDRVVGHPNASYFSVWYGSRDGLSETHTVWRDLIHGPNLDGTIQGAFLNDYDFGPFSYILDFNGDGLP